MDFEELIITNETLNNHLYLSNKLIDVTIKYRHFLINQCKCKCSERNDEFQLIENEYRNVSEEIQRKCKRNDDNHHNEETLPMEKVNEEAKDEDKCDATEVIRSEELCKKYKFRKKKGNKISHKENRDDENCLTKLNQLIDHHNVKEISTKKIRQKRNKRNKKKNQRNDEKTYDIVTVETESGTMYKCPKCDKLYNDYKYLREKHIINVHETVPRFKCHKCKKMFKEYRTRNKHLQYVHATGKHYPCPREDCSAVFVCQKYVNEHVKNAHSTVRPFKCTFPNCEASFKAKSVLITHYSVHSQIKSFVCEWENCTYKTKQKLGLINHMRIHTNERPFVCEWPGCDQRFYSQSSLSYHTNNTHNPIQKPKKFVCQWPGCDTSYTKNSVLKQHMLKHTGNVNLSCDWPGCEYRTYCRALLKGHKRKHSTERNYPCQWPGCERRLKSSVDLALHLRIHSGDKRYKCEYEGCEWRFVDRGNMKKHMKNIHQKPK